MSLLLNSALPIQPRQAFQNAAPAATTRPCSANPVLASGAKKKNNSKIKHPLPPEPPPACLELKGEPLEIQETLEAIARDLQWRIHDNRAFEDAWTFVRYLSPEDLDKYAETKIFLEPIAFDDGKAAVRVSTTDIGSGFVRVQISARFQGEGKTAGTAMTQPATSWTLQSKGTLEKEFLDALQSRYKHVE
jgi:hypothetical protein